MTEPDVRFTLANERTLLADFSEKLGGKGRLQMNLGALQRQGFIVRRRERIHEGPLLDLAFDYERIASRVMDGALSQVIEEARHSQAAARERGEEEGVDAPDSVLGDDAQDENVLEEERQADV